MANSAVIGIIGGGPAGAATAAYLARAGIQCQLFEKTQFPRAHVGESLVPSSTRIFAEIGFLETLDQAGFIRKYGAGWTSPDSPKGFGDHDFKADGTVEIAFGERAQLGIQRDYTYHVDRARFDHLLLEHAKSCGAQVHMETTVNRVDFESERPIIHYQTQDKQRQQCQVDMVIDASGRNTLLGRQLKLKQTDPVFNQFALHRWFTDFDRSAYPHEHYIYIHFLPKTNAWVWQIPINETTTSIGLVTQKSVFQQSQQDQEAFFWQHIQQHPDFYQRCQKATPIRPWTVEADYSYAMSQFCGDRYALIGDAARFVDPIFSSGVSIALTSAKLISEAVIQCLANKMPFSREHLQGFEHTMRRGTKNWYEFIRLYYRLNVLFTYFVAHPRYRQQILQLLQGDVYEEKPLPVLEKMRTIVKQVEQNPEHIWHPYLGTLDATLVNPD